MDRQEHLNWCKQRAIKYCDSEDQMFLAAWISFKSDMSKHEETKNHIALEIGDQIIAVPAMKMLMAGTDGQTLKVMFNEQTRHFIEGFN